MGKNTAQAPTLPRTRYMSRHVPSYCVRVRVCSGGNGYEQQQTNSGGMHTLGVLYSSVGIDS